MQDELVIRAERGDDGVTCEGGEVGEQAVQAVDRKAVGSPSSTQSTKC